MASVQEIILWHFKDILNLDTLKVLKRVDRIWRNFRVAGKIHYGFWTYKSQALQMFLKIGNNSSIKWTGFYKNIISHKQLQISALVGSFVNEEIIRCVQQSDLGMIFSLKELILMVINFLFPMSNRIPFSRIKSKSDRLSNCLMTFFCQTKKGPFIWPQRLNSKVIIIKYGSNFFLNSLFPFLLLFYLHCGRW